MLNAERQVLLAGMHQCLDLVVIDERPDGRQVEAEHWVDQNERGLGGDLHQAHIRLIPILHDELGVERKSPLATAFGAHAVNLFLPLH